MSKYEEALERARKYYKETTNSVYNYKDMLEQIFPDIEESEDRKIKEEIVNYFQCQSRDEPCRKHIHDKWVAWLEKQGKETSWKPSKEEMDVLYGLAYITNQYDEHKEEVITRLYQDLKREFFNGSSYENMFPNTEDGVRRRSTIQVLEYARSLDTYNQYGKADIDKNIAWLEKQDGIDNCPLEGSTNTVMTDSKKNQVEPKFKVGDWITNGDYTWKIVEVKPLDYILQSQDGNIVDDTISHVDEQFHSFTIKDAKIGDVLVASDESLFIFARAKDNAAYYHFSLCKNGSQEISDGKHAWEVAKDCHPATKEQRDLLFEKMKEAGYEWDSEKKELKKFDFSKPIKYNSNPPSIVKEPAWTEDDENILNDMKDTIKECWNGDTRDILLDWFETIKQRIKGE